MKLSSNTTMVLKNFATINQNLVIKEGSELLTMSSMKNIVAKATVEENFPKEIAIYMQNKVLIFDRSLQHNTEINKPIKIITPPIVGVPIFFTIWSVGPSSLIGLKIFLFEKNLMRGSPIKRAINKEVKNANPVLNVIYLKTFKKVKVSTKFNRKL